VAVSDAAAAETRQNMQRRSATDDIINSTDIDAVIIGTSTDTHFRHYQEAAWTAKRSLQPVDMSADSIRKLISAVSSGVAFFTAFNRRFDPTLPMCKKRIVAGEIGSVES
jgi:myo-inositol 2-dehydrogenase/D-chiro-inositol 1-dehydrogenase